MAFFYRSGEPIAAGDFVLYHGEHAKVEFVADPTDDPNSWYVRKFGGGVMLHQSPIFGSVFLERPQDDEHLEFRSSATGSAKR